MYREKVYLPLLLFIISFLTIQTIALKVQAQTLLDPLTQPKFVNPLPNALDPNFVYTEASSNHYEIEMKQTSQWLGLVDPATGTNLMTTIYGYGNAADASQGPTFPGRTFVVQKDQPITVQWYNHLPTTGHLLPVDTTLHWAYALPGYDASYLTKYGPPVVPHLHGGHTESASDGLPEQWWVPNLADNVHGPTFVKTEYTYSNDQRAATLWYHDHGLGITRLNVYAGLAGFYLLRDNQDTGLIDNPLGLPAFPYEVPIVIQDRMFSSDGQLYYPITDPALPPGTPNPTVLPEFFGDFILVNGVTWPVMQVEPRKYRLRILNGSDSRFYDMTLTNGNTFLIIGTDDALLTTPVSQNHLLIGPGERYDVIVDFAGSQGKTIVVKNSARSPYPKGATVNPHTTGQIMAFNVSLPLASTESTLAATLNDPFTPLVQNGPTRKLMLFEGTDSYGRLQPMLGVVGETLNKAGNLVDGTQLFHESITELPMVNTTEVWEIYNATVDAHPIHLHLVAYQLMNRQKFTATVTTKANMNHDGTISTGGILSNIKLKGQPKGPEPYELGWKDTGLMYPGEVTRIITTFDREGTYVWHCHILSHEDHEMMRHFEVIPSTLAAKQSANNVESMKTKEIKEYSLNQNYPNPFNPTTIINYTVPEKGFVNLTIHDVLGKEVAKLVNGEKEPGSYNVEFNAEKLSSGIYFYKLQTGKFVSTKKMILLR